MGISAHYPSLLHVTRKLNKMRHTHCAAHQETELHSVEKLFALGHSRSDQATAKRRPSSAKSHKPPAANAVVTELSKSARASCEQSHHGCAEHCVPRKPTNAFPTCSRTRFAPPVVGSPQTCQHHVSKKHTESGHTDRFSNMQRKRWTQKKTNDVARGSCLLHAAVGQQTGITSSINQKCEDSQLEMGQTSNCRRQRIHGSSRTLSDVNAKYWEVEPFAAIVMCHSETPRHVQQQKRSRICHSVCSFQFRREPQQGATPKLPT